MHAHTYICTPVPIRAHHVFFLSVITNSCENTQNGPWVCRHWRVVWDSLREHSRGEHYSQVCLRAHSLAAHVAVKSCLMYNGWLYYIVYWIQIWMISILSPYNWRLLLNASLWNKWNTLRQIDVMLYLYSCIYVDGKWKCNLILTCI